MGKIECNELSIAKKEKKDRKSLPMLLHFNLLLFLQRITLFLELTETVSNNQKRKTRDAVVLRSVGQGWNGQNILRASF